MSSLGKGKGKAQDVIEISDTDSDDDLFSYKPRTYSKPLLKDPSPIDLVDFDDSDDEEAEDTSHKRKRVKHKRTHKPSLPQWTRKPSVEPENKRRRGRSTTSDRVGTGKGEDPIVLGDSDDGDVHSKATSKSPTKSRRAGKSAKDVFEIELTPPPEMPEERKAELEKRLLEHFELSDDEIPSAAPPSDVPSSSQNAADLGPEIQITVNMVASEERRSTGSSLAVKGYERGRVFTLHLNSPISDLRQVLAHRISKLPEDLILVYEGQRIYAVNQTPAQLGIYSAAKMSGYEKEVWEQVEKEKRDKRTRLLTGVGDDLLEDEPTGTSDVTPSSASQSTATIPPPATNGTQPPSATAEQHDAAPGLRIILRGDKGEVRCKVPLTQSCSGIVKYYATKMGVDGSSLKLWVDGEGFGAEQTLADIVDEMGLESGDIVEVQ